MRTKTKMSSEDCYIDNKKLIELVKKNSILYDNTNALYKSKKTDHLWKAIAEELQQPADLVKMRWISLRTTFLREIRNERAQKNKRRRIWYLTKEMEFLRKFVFTGQNSSIKTSKSGDVDDDENTDDQSEDNIDNKNYGSETTGSNLLVKSEYSFPKAIIDDPLDHSNFISMQTIMQPQPPPPQPVTSIPMSTQADYGTRASQQGLFNDLGEQNLAFFRSIVPEVLKLTDRRQRLFRQTILSALNSSLDEQETETQ